MTFHSFKNILLYFLTLSILVLSTTTQAKGWDFKENKGENCVVLSPVYDVNTKRRIASIGLLKINSHELDKLAESERDLFLRGLTFVLETKRQFKTVRGVGVQLTSRSLNISLSYRNSERAKNKRNIYTSSNAGSFEIVDALNKNEDLTIEFNTPSSGTQYGMVSYKAFKKQYAKFDKCQKRLE